MAPMDKALSGEEGGSWPGVVWSGTGSGLEAKVGWTGPERDILYVPGHVGEEEQGRGQRGQEEVSGAWPGGKGCGLFAAV